MSCAFLTALREISGLLGPALALVLCAGAPGQAACLLEAVAVTPLTLAAGHFILAAEINGKQADMLLDTGASMTSLSLTSAPKFGVSLHLRDTESPGIGGSERTYRGFAGRMRLGAIDWDGHVVGGTSAAPLSGFDGLLGTDILAEYDVDLDIVGQHVVVYEAKGECRTPTVSIAPPLHGVPLVYSKGDLQPEIEMSIDGRHFRALIDSGAPRSKMFRNAAERLGLDMSGLRSSQGQWSRGIGEFPVRSFVHVFDDATIGSLVLHGFSLDVVDQSGFGVNRVHVGSLLPDETRGEAGGEDILLGADFLRAVHVWISHSSQRLIMQYPPQASVLPR